MLCALATCLLLQQPGEIEYEKKRLVGAWYIHEFTSNGWKAGIIGNNGPELVFRQNWVITYGLPGCRYKIDTSKTPWTIDFFYLNGARESGVYKLEEGVLTLCLKEKPPWPKDFTCERGSDRMLSVYRRAPVGRK